MYGPTSSALHGREAGFIVGETSPLEFTFVSSREMLPPRLEYVVVPGVEERGAPSVAGAQPGANGGAERVDVLAQVVEVGVDSAILSERLTYEETLAILRGTYAPAPKMYGRARVIGFSLSSRCGCPVARRSPAPPSTSPQTPSSSASSAWRSRRAWTSAR